VRLFLILSHLSTQLHSVHTHTHIAESFAYLHCESTEAGTSFLRRAGLALLSILSLHLRFCANERASEYRTCELCGIMTSCVVHLRLHHLFCFSGAARLRLIKTPRARTPNNEKFKHKCSEKFYDWRLRWIKSYSRAIGRWWNSTLVKLTFIKYEQNYNTSNVAIIEQISCNN
jgi:hypothetical protein